MKKANGFLAVRIVLALCVVLACILWATAQYSGGESRQISGPEDLRQELRRSQLLAPPSESTLPYDAGRFTYVPGPNPFEREFIDGLVSRLEADGRQTWPVTVFEEKASKETVFLNADGREIWRLPPDTGYDPVGTAPHLFPGWRLDGTAAFRPDPSLVLMSARLVDPAHGAVKIWDGAAASNGGNSGQRPASAPAGFKNYLVVWNSSSNIWLGGDSGTAAGVAAIDAGYSHGVALHDDGSMTRIGIDPETSAVTEQRFESAGAALASAGALGDTAVIGFDGALRHVSGGGELMGAQADVGNITEIVSGTGFVLALKNGGTVLSQGAEGALLPPSGLNNVAEVDAGASFCVARRHNGSVVAWGDARVATNIASGVSAVSASRRGAHCLALGTDGTVTAWGDDRSGQCRVPETLSGVRAVAAGGYHSVVLKQDGTVDCWGIIKHAPPLLTNVVSISASCLDVCAVTADGTVAIWGRGCPLGGVRLSAKTPGVCQIMDAKIVDCGIYMAVVRAREGLLEGDADGDGVSGVEEVFLRGTDPLTKDAGVFAQAPAAAEPTHESKNAPVKRKSGLRAAGASMSLYSLESGTTYYADASQENDGGDGLSWENAKRTIQAAVDAAQPGDTVVVTNGVYDYGTRVTPGGLFNNRLVVTNGVLVKSVNGAGATEIRGSGSDYFDTWDAVRCVYITDGVLVGFTLQGGAAVAHWTSPDQRDKSGGCLNMGDATAESEVRNCIISGGVAYDGGGVCRGRLVSCVIRSCNAYYPGGADGSVLLNCTVTANGDWGWSSCGGARGCGVTNSVVYGNTGWESPNCHCCTVSYSCSDESYYGAGNVSDNLLFADPLFNDAGNGDFSLLATSPCIDAGSDVSVTSETDMRGNARIQGLAVDMGAYEAPTAGAGGGEHLLIVVGGAGGCVLAAEDTANVGPGMRSGYLFSCWAVSPEGTLLGSSFDALESETSVMMPDCDVTLTAVFERNYSDSDGDGMADWWEADYSVYGFDPNVSNWEWPLGPMDDFDNDGLCNADEAAWGTDPNCSDSDGDGLSDGWEYMYSSNGFDPSVPAPADESALGTFGDYDDDGLQNWEESNCGTDPFNWDTDGDWLSDGWEVDHAWLGFSPTDPGDGAGDYDGDGIPTGWEVYYGIMWDYWDGYTYGDADGDGLDDYEEYLLGTNPTLVDTDEDELSDFIEVSNGLNPLVKCDPNDYDGDGLPNAQETVSSPYDPDSDDDGIGDYREIVELHSNPLSAHSDTDGLTDLEEDQLGTDPTLDDTDGDGLSDSLEVLYGLNPLVVCDPNDYDGDGLSNVLETASCPYDSDSDDDGLGDWVEVTVFHSNPTDADSDGDELPDMFEATWFGDPNSYQTKWDDYDGDGFTNGQELQFGSDPSFAVFTACTTWGNHLIRWTPCLDSTNYNVKVFAAGVLVKDFNLLDCSVVVTGDFSTVQGLVEVTGVSPSMGSRTASAALPQPSQPNLTAWKITDPFTFDPYLLPDGRLVVFERKVWIGQSVAKHREFFIASDNCGGNDSNIDLYDAGLMMEWQDDKGTLTVAPYPYCTMPGSVRVNVATDAQEVTIRLLANWDVLSMSGLIHLDTPLYLLKWSPTVNFTADNRLLQTDNGLVLISLANQNLPENSINFTVDCAGRPFDNSVPDFSDLFSDSPFGPPSISYTDGVRGILPTGGSSQTGCFRYSGTGNVVPPGGPGPGPGPLDPPDTVGDGSGSFILNFIKPVVPDQPWGGGVTYEEILVAGNNPVPGDYPLDTEAIRDAVQIESPSYILSRCTQVNIAPDRFYIDIEGADTNILSRLIIDPIGFHIWEPGESEYYAYVSLDGLVIWDQIVERLEDSEFVDEYPTIFNVIKKEESRKCGCATCSELGGPSSGSVRFRVPLGATGYNKLAGFVWFDAQGSNVTVNPSLFSVIGDSSVHTNCDGGALRVWSTDQGGLDVLITPLGGIEEGVHVSVRKYQAVGQPAEEYAWEIVNKGPDKSKVLFRKLVENAKQKVELFSYEDGCWVRRPCDLTADENPLSSKEITRHVAVGGGEGVTNLVYEGDVLVKGSYKESHIIGSGDSSVKCETLTAEWSGALNPDVWYEKGSTYWVDTANLLLNGRLKFRYSPYDGAWEYHTYDSLGRETLSVVPLDGTRPPDFVTNNAPATLYAFANCPGLSFSVTVKTYDPYDLSGALGLDIRSPRMVTGYVVGNGQSTLVSREWHSYVRGIDNGYATLEHRVTRAASQEAAASESNDANDKTVTVIYAETDNDSANAPGCLAPAVLRGRTLSETRNGIITTWVYAKGDYDPLATPQFTFAVDGAYIRVVTTRGTAESGKTTYDVEIFDASYALTFCRETRLHLGGSLEQDPVLSRETSRYDERQHLLSTLYSDGTSESNVWDCCRIQTKIGRDGVSREFLSAPGEAHVTTVLETSLSLLPGSGSLNPAVETYTDALGRETNSVRRVYSGINPANNPAYADLVTRTEYPFGTDNVRVITDPLGVRSVSRRYYDSNGQEIEETASAAVTSRVTRVQGGSILSEKLWYAPVSGTRMYTAETRETSWRVDGCRVETVTSEASGMPTATSVTLYDFLDRVVSSATPSGVTSNFYGSDGRLARVCRTGTPDTLFNYDDFGNVMDTALDVDGNGTIDYAGFDRITRTETGYELSDNQWYSVTTSKVWNVEGQDMPLQVSATRVKMTGLGVFASNVSGVPDGAMLTSQSETRDWRNNRTISYTYTDASTASAWQVIDTPESGQNTVRASVAGQQISDVSSTGVSRSYTYDGFARKSAVTDGRDNTSRTFYNALGQVDYTEDASSSCTSYTYDELGRRTAVTDALTNTTHTAYDAEGHAVATWGATYPVAYEYDTAGRMVAMATTRNPDYSSINLLTLLTAGGRLSDSESRSILSAQSVDVTRWLYDSATGLLTNKVYADGNGPSYTYTPEGRLATRTWARGVTTVYTYDTIGQLFTVAYSDGTPGVEYTYDRLGRPLSAVTAVSTNRFEYHGLDPVTETQNGDTLARRYHTSSGLLSEVGINARGPVNFSWLSAYEFITQHQYDEYGQETYIYGGSTACDGVWCEYVRLPGSAALQSMSYYEGYYYSLMGGWTRAYEPSRDLITAVSNLWNTSLVSAYVYENDAIGRRTVRRDIDGSSDIGNSFLYNDHSEVTNAVMGNHTYGYGFDPIGNRVQSAVAVGSAQSDVTDYAANALNQYASINGPQPPVSNPTYDFDGNMLTCSLPTGDWAFTWDAENRMVTAANGSIMVSNVYDHQSRRIRKEVSFYDSGTTAYCVQSAASFLYDGWNLVREITGQGTSYSTNYYTWGLDLSGTLQGAGGVGGLLAIYTPDSGNQQSAVHIPVYDVNGNVTAYLDSTGTTAAAFEYDAFGNPISGPVAVGLHLPFRFSTKYLDDETGLYYYGYRYYSSEQGRWVSRDPLGDIASCQALSSRTYYHQSAILRTSVRDEDDLVETSGGATETHSSDIGPVHLFAFCDNAPLFKIDILGNQAWVEPAVAILDRIEVEAPAIEAEIGVVAGRVATWFTYNGQRFSTLLQALACRGTQVHQVLERRLPAAEWSTEYWISSVSRRADGVNRVARVVMEIKPNTARAIQRGVQQVKDGMRGMQIEMPNSCFSGQIQPYTITEKAGVFVPRIVQ